MSNFPPGSKVVVQGLKKASSVGVNLNGLVGNVQGPGTKAGRLAVEIREKTYSLKEQNIVPFSPPLMVSYVLNQQYGLHKLCGKFLDDFNLDIDADGSQFVLDLIESHPDDLLELWMSAVTEILEKNINPFTFHESPDEFQLEFLSIVSYFISVSQPILLYQRETFKLLLKIDDLSLTLRGVGLINARLASKNFGAIDNCVRSSRKEKWITWISPEALCERLAKYVRSMSDITPTRSEGCCQRDILCTCQCWENAFKTAFGLFRYLMREGFTMIIIHSEMNGSNIIQSLVLNAMQCIWNLGQRLDWNPQHIGKIEPNAFGDLVFKWDALALLTDVIDLKSFPTWSGGKKMPLGFSLIEDNEDEPHSYYGFMTMLISEIFSEARGTLLRSEAAIMKKAFDSILHNATPDRMLDQMLATVHSPKCEVCGSKENLRYCQRCKSVRYCGKKCQTAHWKKHKKMCKKLKTQRGLARHGTKI